MAKLNFRGAPAQTKGELPKLGTTLNFNQLVKNDLSVVAVADYGKKRKVLNIFPSIDTGVCATSVRQFNKMAGELTNTVVLNISLDLPFAQARFCGAEGIKNVETLSGFRSQFGDECGLVLQDTPLVGLYARAVIVLNEDNKVIHTEMVSDIVNEPNYEAVLQIL